jgi:NAD(P)-dependent dehydrogenase (short-subunit alcohol dehydrogenase family)
MNQKLSGKTALITGGNSGIGLATARLFREHGARVAIVGRDPRTLESARQMLGEDVLAIQCDVAKVDEIERLMKTIASHFEKLDVLFANAASERPARFEQITEAQFDESVAINFKGAFFTIQKALPLLSRDASVIVTTSISNEAAAPNFGVYAACKAALRSLVRTLGAELIERGIRVNALSPGPVDTPSFDRWGLPQETLEAIRSNFERRSPSKRFGQPEEVARAALFLASSDASYCVGSEIVVDGGMSLPL